MQFVTFLCSLKQFLVEDFDPHAPFTFNGFTLSKGREPLNETFNSEPFLTRTGTNAQIAFDSFPYFYKTTSYVNLTIDDLQKLSFTEGHPLYEFFLVLWLIKDHSSNLETFFLYAEFVGQAGSRDFTPRSSNASGYFSNSSFTIAELTEAKSWHAQLRELLNHEYEREVEITYGLQKSPGDLVRDDSRNKLSRAMRFLGTARGASYLPEKVANYIAVLESLFTTDSFEITQKVAERTACYLQENSEEKYNDFLSIKTAYQLRSNYFHGQPLDKKHNMEEKQIVISKRLDQMVRMILKKVISRDWSLFDKPRKEFEEWCNRMVLS